MVCEGMAVEKCIHWEWLQCDFRHNPTLRGRLPESPAHLQASLTSTLGYGYEASVFCNEGSLFLCDGHEGYKASEADLILLLLFASEFFSSIASDGSRFDLFDIHIQVGLVLGFGGVSSRRNTEHDDNTDGGDQLMHWRRRSDLQGYTRNVFAKKVGW
ncbi:hypothetical protein L6452_22272 [Arctium lappa]|uniref:Uncharacterized protein n=1 Tax=Arctium lappa TaxID=4217 RepID=A0ACB9AZC3_ARCLA|nr:hypothetical protein L6452_22272 [Arctium lappa]